ncbi:palmitoyltransferase for Vac8p [Haplosporangium sp. Z 11]|nr:palmitoyltransferase for Vac8p [Haplosporangium sp. Z 11]
MANLLQHLPRENGIATTSSASDPTTIATTNAMASTEATTTAIAAGNSSTMVDPVNGELTVGGYKVHASALAAPSMAPSLSQNLTAMTAAQHAAAIAANDTLHNNHRAGATDPSSDPSSSQTSIVSVFADLLSRSLPLALTAVIGYIYYVYTFRVCIDYILHSQHRPIQAGLYLGIFNILALLFFISYARSIFRTPGSPMKASSFLCILHPIIIPPHRNPPPPIPPKSTPYQPQRAPKSFLTNSRGNATNNNHSSTQPPTGTTPLLRSNQAATRGTFTYQATEQSAASERKEGRTGNSSLVGNDSGHTSFRIDMDHDAGAGQESVQQQPIATLSISKRDGGPRWCDICKIVKPDRCHHCSECDTCVLRMDHHCPWVNGCIGYDNHKFFYLFILYASILAVWIVATMVPLLTMAIQHCDLNGPQGLLGEGDNYQQAHCIFDIQWAIITIISFLLALLIVSFTMAHTIYILKNRTTIESLQDVRKTFIRVQYTETDPSAIASSSTSPYSTSRPRFNVVLLGHGQQLWDRGSWMANWKSIMGPSWWLWFLPYANTPGDGIHDVYNDKVYDKLVAAALTERKRRYRGSNSIPPTGNFLLTSGAASSQSTLISGVTDESRSDSSPSMLDRGLSRPLENQWNSRQV